MCDDVMSFIDSIVTGKSLIGMAVQRNALDSTLLAARVPECSLRIQ